MKNKTLHGPDKKHQAVVFVYGPITDEVIKQHKELIEQLEKVDKGESFSMDCPCVQCADLREKAGLQREITLPPSLSFAIEDKAFSAASFLHGFDSER